jgi:hypothetical protein
MNLVARTHNMGEDLITYLGLDYYGESLGQTEKLSVSIL